MQTRSVLYINEDIREEITLDEIVNRVDYIEVKENIFCIEENCECRMVYVPRGVKVAYFKRLKGHNHAECCVYFSIPEENRGRRRNLSTSSSILRINHKRNMLKGIYKSYKETEEQRNSRLERERERARVKRNQTVNRANEQLEVSINNPTTSTDGRRIDEGERNPPVKRRHSILDVTLIDIGDTEVVIGELVSVSNSENQTILTITDKQHSKEFKIYLEQVFFENSALNTPGMFRGLTELLESSFILTSAVGEIIVRNEEIGMLVLAEEDLGFNGLRLGSLLLTRNFLQEILE